MTARVFIVDGKTFPLHLRYQFAGTGAGAGVGYFQQAGIPSALAGPGDIAQAHKPDEFIEIAELEKCAAFLDALCEDLERE